MTHRTPLPRARRLLAALAPLAALALLAAACGGDADSEATPSPSPATTATAAAPASTPSPTPTPTATPSPAPTEAPAFPLTVEDAEGTAITIRAAPSRIVSYSPGATEILFAIGAGDRVAATDEFSDYPPEALALPKLAYSGPDPERALALEPDLVLMASQQREQVGQFRDLGMTVLYLREPESLEGVYEAVARLGAITGNRGEADALAASMRGRAEAVAAAVADAEAEPRVFFELTADLYTVGPDTFVGVLLTLSRGRNVAEGALTPFPQLGAEAVIAADPQVVLLADAEWGETPEKVCARPGWDAISACREGRVHPVDGDLTSRPGPRIVDGLEQVARLLHPDRFPAP